MSVRPRVPASTAKALSARDLQFWSQLHILDTPTIFFQNFEKFQNGRNFSQKYAKIGTFAAKSVARCTTKSAACSNLAFCQMLVAYVVMMHDFFGF